MTILDWVLIAILGLFFIRGLFRGFLIEIFDLLALIAGYFAVRLLGPVVTESLQGRIPIPGWVLNLAIVIILFMVVAFFVRFLGSLFKKAAKKAALGGIDRIFGAIFSMVKGTLILLILFVLFSIVPLDREVKRYAENGQVSFYFLQSARWVVLFLDDEYFKAIPDIPIDPELIQLLDNDTIRSKLVDLLNGASKIGVNTEKEPQKKDADNKNQIDLSALMKSLNKLSPEEKKKLGEYLKDSQATLDEDIRSIVNRVKKLE